MLTERANSRGALVEAAFEEFTTHGYEATTVAGIAERAGVTTGAVYAHFTGKLDLLLATVGLTPIGDIGLTLTDVVATRGNSLAGNLARRPDRRRVLLLDVIVAARRDPTVASTLRSGLEGYVRATARAVDDAAAAGSVAPAVSPDALSRLLAVLNLGMIVFAALDARTPPAGAFEQLVTALLSDETSSSSSGSSDALSRVQARTAEVGRAESARHDEIVAALEEGHSLRAVGAAAGMSHEAVRRIANRTKDDGRR